MAISTLLQSAKLYYEDAADTRSVKQIDEVLFPTKDDSRAATVRIDDYTGLGFAMAAIRQGAPANVRPYVAGSGNEYEVLAAREKTPIDETLRDAAVAGLEATAPQAAHIAEAARKIVSGPKGHIQAFIMMKRKMALDVYLTGKMVNYNKEGDSVSVDFLRDGALTKTNDFSAVAFDAAIKAQFVAHQPFSLPHGNLACILGSSWYGEFQKDSVVLAKRNATQSNAYIVERMQPPLLANCHGLRVVGLYNVDGMDAPVWLLTYTPDRQYRATDGGALADYMPAAKMIMFNLGGEAYNCSRGVDVINSRGVIVRAQGDLVFDSFIQDDPTIEWIRSSCRKFMVRGNINHTSVCTGSNFN